MTSVKTENSLQRGTRGRLSPDVVEILDMLKALEGNVANQPSKAASR